MKVLVPKHSGFCPGVKNAEKTVFKELENYSGTAGLYILGMMINNREYIDYLTKKGIRTIESIEDADKEGKFFIRTHGINKSLENEYSKSLNLVDLTCKNVKKVQLEIEKHSSKNAFIIISGKKSHPEVIGLESYGQNTAIIETDEDLKKLFDRNELLSKFPYFFITSQTTGRRDFFKYLIKNIKLRWPEKEIKIFDSICPVTERKEFEALELQKAAQISFIIGDPLSSNANKLFNLLYENDKNSLFIKDLKELKSLELNLKQYNSALVVSSASTPSFIEKEIMDYLEKI